MTVLPDGTRLTIRELGPDDKRAIAEGFAHLSPRSRYRRFFSPMRELSEDALVALTTVDDRHVAFTAVDEHDVGVGVARYIRTGDDPPTAEIALTVLDEWQGRGVGGMLLNRLAEHARDDGVERLTALILSENRPMLALMRRFGRPVSQTRDGDTVEIVVALDS